MSVPQKELETMPVWQNHEHRITALEVTISGLSNKLDSVENTVKEGNKEQKEMLAMINNKMVEEFFGRKKTSHDTKMKLFLKIGGGIIGAGSFLFLAIEKLISLIGG